MKHSKREEKQSRQHKERHKQENREKNLKIKCRTSRHSEIMKRKQILYHKQFNFKLREVFTIKSFNKIRDL